MKVEYYSKAAYLPILELQRERFHAMCETKAKHLAVEQEWLMMVEHQPVYTLGVHGNAANITHEAWLRSQGAEVHRIERGGDVTFHGPGQLVVYPLIDLEKRGLGVKSYINILEEAVIRTMAEYGITADRVEGATGVWLGIGTPRERKISAIGVKISRYCTMHGLSLNVNTDLKWFQAINPCGFTDRGVTTIALETGSTESLTVAAARLRRHLLELIK